MSVTFTSGKKAGAFYLSNGEIVYVLFEKTRSSSSHPSVPHWSCWFVGNYESALKAVHGSASACVGGSLQAGPGKWIKPENYISAWKREINSAGLIRIQEWGGVKISLLNTTKYSLKKEDVERMASEIFRKHGREDLINEVIVENKSVSVQIDTGLEMIVDLYRSEGGVFSTYGLFTSVNDVTDVPVVGDIHVKHDVDYVPPDVTMYKLPFGGLLVNYDNQSKAYSQSGIYAAESDYVMEVIFDAELKKPGLSKVMIPAFRLAQENPSEISEESTVTIQLDVTNDCSLMRYYKNKFVDIYKELRGIDPDSFNMTLKLSDITENNVYNMFVLLTSSKEANKFIKTSWSIVKKESNVSLTDNFQLVV